MMTRLLFLRRGMEGCEDVVMVGMSDDLLAFISKQ